MFRLLILTSVIISYGYAAAIPKGLVPMLDGRIVGGEPTTIEEFPHQVSMRYLGSHRCGGSIISERVIVSAAHCVVGVSSNSIKINVGSTYRLKGGRSYSVEKIIRHELYKPNTMDNDIAILILSENLEFNDAVKPIDLPISDELVEDGQIALASGWGTTQEGLPFLPDTLQFVKVNVINRQKCDELYRAAGYKISDKMICAGSEKGGRDSCQGDSGGPLISEGKLIGVVSWGYGCGRTKFPGIYANVSGLLKWIEDYANF